METSPQSTSYLHQENVKENYHKIKDDLDEQVEIDPYQNILKIAAKGIVRIEKYLENELAFLDFLESQEPADTESEAPAKPIRDWPEAA